MKKKFFGIFYIAAAAVVLFNLIFSVRDSMVFSMARLPQGTLIGTVESPGGQKKLLIYRVENSIGTAIRVAASDGKTSRNVFWQTDLTEVQAEWLNWDVISVNHIEINVTDGGFYDCRSGYSIFNPGSIEGMDDLL